MNYTILPLDEPALEIDTNKRTITIPKESPFNKLVGVTGDHTAETIYFKVDRYFDFTDLDTQNIYIEWRRLGEEEDHVSPIYIKDASSEPNKLIFGWMITDEMTSKPCTIEFAVRFFSYDGDTIHYSLGTLPAQIKISDTLYIDIVDKISDGDVLETLQIQSMIKNRLTNSKIYGGEESGAPSILVNLIDKYTFIEAEAKVNNNMDSIEVDLEDQSGEPTRLIFLGQSPDTGTLSYIWYYDINRSNSEKNTWGTIPTEDNAIGIINNEFYLQTFDTEYVAGKKYFIKNDLGEMEPYINQNFPINNTDTTPVNDIIIYEKYASLVPQKAGEYIASVTNTVGVKEIVDSEGNIIQGIPVNPSAEEFSRKIKIPGAELVVHKKDPIIQFADNGSSSTTFSLDENNLETNLPEKGQIYYIWKNSAGVVLSEENQQESELTVSEPGDYYLQIKHVRNRDEKISEGALYRFSEHGSAFGYSHSYGLNPMFIITPSQPVQIDIEITSNDRLSDKNHIKWYKCDQYGNKTGEDISSMVGTQYNNFDISSGSYNVSFYPTAAGNYSFELVNVYSGETHETEVNTIFQVGIQY